MRIKNYLFFTLLLILSVNAIAREFKHPGLLHKASDLERMKYNVFAGVEPWRTSFSNMGWDKYSRFDYQVRGDSSWTVVGRENPAIHKREFEDDAIAAYQNALMWSIREDQRYADKAIEILNRWRNLKNVNGIPLNAGLYGYHILNAAEIIRHTNAGWKQADIKKFEDMLVYPGYSSTKIPSEISSDLGTFYWRTYMGDPGRAGNQDIAANLTLMSLGVFLDNDTIYDRALRYIRGQKHLPYDMPYASGPSKRTTQYANCDFTEVYRNERFNTIEDYGYDGVITNYIYNNGQCQESSRDQGHSMLGISLLTLMAEVAWNQGDDLYGWAQNRLLLGIEYTLKYNISYEYSYEDQPKPWEPLPPNDFYQIPSRTDRRVAKKINPHVECDIDRITRGDCLERPYYELPLNHYMYRTNIPEDSMLWLKRARDIGIAETRSFETRSKTLMDCPGWGGLTFRRPVGCAGEPVDTVINGVAKLSVPIMPGRLNAANFDYYPTDRAGGQGITYRDLSRVGTSDYRPADSAQIKLDNLEGHYLSNLEPGEWYRYTLMIPATGNYELSIRYSTSSANTKVSINIGDEDMSGERTIPMNERYSNGVNNWATFSVVQDLKLTKGVQNLRLNIHGEEKGLQISELIIKEGQIINFDSIPNKFVNDSIFELSAVSSAGLPIEYLSTDTSIAKVIGNTVTIVGVGKVSIIASQVGNDFWGQAPQTIRTFEVKFPLIQESVLFEKIKIYPNPTYGLLNIEVPFSGSKRTQIVVFDILGNTVEKIDYARAFEQVDLTRHPLGVYTVRIECGTFGVNKKVILE